MNKEDVIKRLEDIGFDTRPATFEEIDLISYSKRWKEEMN